MSLQIRVSTSSNLQGSCQIPGDKSISHRALIFGALASGTSRASNFLNGSDCLATAQVMRDLGVAVGVAGTDLTIEGLGLDGLKEPNDVLNCQNSGTTIRLMTGLLAPQPFFSVLSGSEQIRRRPMGRVIAPLNKMGAVIQGRSSNRLAPIAISPSTTLKGYVHNLEVASAQVKSALMLAGLFASEPTTIVEPGPSRDHTERLLRAMGAIIDSESNAVTVMRPERALLPFKMQVPSDPSSAAFVIAAALIVPKSKLVLTGVSVNFTRTGFFDAVKQMGACLEMRDQRESLNEPVADLAIEFGGLKACEFGGEIIVRMIDELPILAVVATQAQGVTTIRNAKELKVKETNRIDTTVSELRKMGAKIEALDDGFVIEGPTKLKGTKVSSHGDHRLAMAMAVAGLCASGETVVDGAEVTIDSFPGFALMLHALGATISEERV